jgi:TPR repeat protein
VNSGVAAYRAGDYGRAWRLLETGAKSGEAKAQRYLGYIILDGKAPAAEAADFFAGVALLKRAAVAGDYAALIRLEDLRRQHLAHSPSLEDMIEIESARAAKGDPVAAWRLARRYENGEGVVRSEGDEAKWLEVAAAVETNVFPKAGEAAFRLCEIRAMGEEARDPAAARRWCAVAAEKGHTGAAIALRRLASLAG